MAELLLVLPKAGGGSPGILDAYFSLIPNLSLNMALLFPACEDLCALMMSVSVDSALKEQATVVPSESFIHRFSV